MLLVLNFTKRLIVVICHWIIWKGKIKYVETPMIVQAEQKISKLLWTRISIIVRLIEFVQWIVIFIHHLFSRRSKVIDSRNRSNRWIYLVYTYFKNNNESLSQGDEYPAISVLTNIPLLVHILTYGRITHLPCKAFCLHMTQPLEVPLFMLKTCSLLTRVHIFDEKTRTSKKWWFVSINFLTFTS